MALDYKPGTSLKVTINKNIKRDAARKTLERLFMQDDAIRGPIDARERNFNPRALMELRSPACRHRNQSQRDAF